MMLILFISVLNIQCTDLNNLLTCNLEANQGQNYLHYMKSIIEQSIQKYDTAVKFMYFADSCKF